MGFKLDTRATITNLNLRNEKHGKEEKVHACDITMKVDITAEEAKQLVVEDSWKDSLWDKEGRPKFFTISEIKFSASFEEHTLQIHDHTFYKVKLCKFSAVINPGHRLDLKLTAQVLIEPGDADYLLTWLEQEVDTIIDFSQHELDLDDPLSDDQD